MHKSWYGVTVLLAACAVALLAGCRTNPTAPVGRSEYEKTFDQIPKFPNSVEVNRQFDVHGQATLAVTVRAPDFRPDDQDS